MASHGNVDDTRRMFHLLTELRYCKPTNTVLGPLVRVGVDTATSYDTRRMFHLLTELRYCKPTNTVLGPLVRVHLNDNNIEAATKEFVNLANKYNKTPLKHELLCKILTTMGDGGSEETFIINEKSNGSMNKLVQKVLNIDKKVHGPGDVQVRFITTVKTVYSDIV
ncbi:hypothetical protein RR48_00475 [Papilio machaon]|uniref:Uncharacterized protein n=1 Tax=Papilio machaon TaxID=76193 RepID=A0A0N1PJ39_PAPMA|nr:hypothetical protein RR48_00475 [Papilio machaon]